MSDINKGLCIIASLIIGGTVILKLRRLYEQKLKEKDEIIDELLTKNEVLRNKLEFCDDINRSSSSKTTFVIHTIDPHTERIIDREVAIFDDHREALEYVKKQGEAYDETGADYGFIIEAI